MDAWMISIVTILTIFIHLIGTLWMNQILAECFEMVSRSSKVKGAPEKAVLTLLIPYSQLKNSYWSLAPRTPDGLALLAFFVFSQVGLLLQIMQANDADL